MGGTVQRTGRRGNLAGQLSGWLGEGWDKSCVMAQGRLGGGPPGRAAEGPGAKWSLLAALSCPGDWETAAFLWPENCSRPWLRGEAVWGREGSRAGS